MEGESPTLNEGKCQSDNKNTFGFRSRYHLSQSYELEKFEMDFFNIVNSIKFSNYKNDFQRKFDADIDVYLKTYLFSLIKPAIFLKCQRSNIKSF